MNSINHRLHRPTSSPTSGVIASNPCNYDQGHAFVPRCAAAASNVARAAAATVHRPRRRQRHRQLR